MRFELPVKKIIRSVFALFFAVVGSGVNGSALAQAQEKNPVDLSRFELLTTNTGWVLLDAHVFWTSNGGKTWEEIGPSIPSGAFVQDVEFKDGNTGWVLWTTANPDGGADFQLAHTADRGATWTIRSLSLFEPGEIASNAEKAEMGWFGRQTGWISVKQNTGSNFSIGVLFTTTDGGYTWRRSNLPVADKVHFSDPQTGSAVGGPAGDQLFETRDGGTSWEKIQLADLLEAGQSVVYPPAASAEQGILVTTHLGEENTLNVYRPEHSSGEWLLDETANLDVQVGRIGLSLLDAQNFVATIPGTPSILRMENGLLHVLENQDGLSASIVELDMASLEVGWGKSLESNCATVASPGGKTHNISCSTSTQLLQTSDGGITWQGLNLPNVAFDSSPLDASRVSNTVAVSTIPGTANTVAVVGQGFDKCEIPTLSQMQTWWNGSPYKTVNLYIGGSSRGCTNSALTPSFLFRLNQQGWRFIPTWVGPQAPCTGYPSRMSSDVIEAYAQGVSEANLAVERLAALGLTDPDMTGSVIYYDIEAYGTDAACRAAVNSFMNGWVSQIRARGSLAGVYGSTLCNTGLNDFMSISNVPDVIWPARWYHNLGSGFYDPTANVWNLGSCVPNTAWSNHQRLRQYEGDHTETWGGLTLAIDSNALDGVVAVLHDYPFVDSLLRTDSDPTNAETVEFTIKFSEAVTGVNRGDFVLTTAGLTSASISSVSGSGATYAVTVNTGSGNGTIRLDVVDNNTIIDGASNPLGGVGSGNGNYISGEIYTINKSMSVDTTGVFRPTNGALYLKNSNITGFADIQINYGLAGDYPVVGDWDGDGDATIGIYRNGSFYLRNSNTIGFADLVFAFGAPGDQPIAGDWDGDGNDTIGIYRNGLFMLRNSNNAGAPEMSFALGVLGDVGIAGDWDGDGMDTTGVFRPSNGALYLKNTNVTGFADIQINYGIPGDKPITGDWNNDGVDTIGIYRNGTFYLRNANTIGFADLVFALGINGDMPIAGNWDGKP
jgi:photosystem II stability/assembly factor-like uncharacterized protein